MLRSCSLALHPKASLRLGLIHELLLLLLLLSTVDFVLAAKAAASLPSRVVFLELHWRRILLVVHRAWATTSFLFGKESVGRSDGCDSGRKSHRADCDFHLLFRGGNPVLSGRGGAPPLVFDVLFKNTKRRSTRRSGEIARRPQNAFPIAAREIRPHPTQ